MPRLLSLLLATVGILGLGWAVPPTEAASVEVTGPTRPNILLILSDDWSWPNYGFMGSDVVATPNLDRLAHEGTVFPVAFNTASLCVPSLRSLLTGLHPHQFARHRASIARVSRQATGTRRNPVHHMDTLARLLSKGGYATFQAGKLWDGSHAELGFEEGTTKNRATLFHPDPNAIDLGRKTLEPVLEFLRTDRKEPFFLWFAPMMPHVPFGAPEQYLTRYREQGWSGPILQHLAMCSWTDDVIGKVLEAIDEQGLRDDTLVVYLSDNGWEILKEGTGAPAKRISRGKGSMYELGLRTPLVFRWPKHIEADRRIDTPVSTVDLFPTLLQIAGVPVPPGRSGRSLAPALLDGATIPGDDVLVGGQFLLGNEKHPAGIGEFVGDAYFVRDGDWYYILYAGDRNHELLFDRSTDPGETKDVSDRHPDRMKRYRERVRQWLDDTGVGRARLGWMPARIRTPPAK